jgi:hypothetical protein
LWEELDGGFFIYRMYRNFFETAFTLFSLWFMIHKGSTGDGRGLVPGSNGMVALTTIPSPLAAGHGNTAFGDRSAAQRIIEFVPGPKTPRPSTKKELAQERAPQG